MDITPIDVDLAALGIGSSSGVRAEGVHASDIYSDLYQDLEPERYHRDGLPPPTLLETGLIFETLLEEGLKRRLVESGEPGDIARPGEFTHTDVYQGTPITIHYNPDLFIFNGQFRLGEIKATWMSPKGGITDPKFDKWFTQIKFYCWCVKTRYARLYVFFVNGSWKPIKPTFLAWDMEFTHDELESNYGMLINHAMSKEMFTR